MSTRLPSDSDAVDSSRATIVRRGGSRTPYLELPAAVAETVATDDRLTIVIDGAEYYATVAGDSDGLLLYGAYETRKQARTTGEGTNRLGEWLRGLDREIGDSVLCDVIVAGERYGLRAPGERAVYTVKHEPRDSLQSIAESLDGDS